MRRLLDLWDSQDPLIERDGLSLPACRHCELDMVEAKHVHGPILTSGFGEELFASPTTAVDIAHRDETGGVLDLVWKSGGGSSPAPVAIVTIVAVMVTTVIQGME